MSCYGAPIFHPLEPRTPEPDENEPEDIEDPESLEGWRVYTDVYDDNFRGEYA
jgi:hypothetical protein